MCTLPHHAVSFLDRAELIDGVTSLIARAKSPELREFRVFELGASDLPWKELYPAWCPGLGSPQSQSGA
jgi:hypothetical protein